MLKVGSETLATIDGAAIKKVCCENCRRNFSYQMEREGTGEGFSWFGIGGDEAKADAELRAQRDLRRQLEQDSDLVPCPGCGHCQSEMVEAAREKRHNWVTVVAMFSGLGFIYSLPLALATDKLSQPDLLVARLIASGTFLLAFGSAFLQAYLRKLYDPNALPIAELLEIAHARCVTDDSLASELPTVELNNSMCEVTASKHDITTTRRPDGFSETPIVEQENVSDADTHAGLQFLFAAACCGALGVMLLGLLPNDQKWRALAAVGLGGVFAMFGVKLMARRT